MQKINAAPFANWQHPWLVHFNVPHLSF